MSLPKVSIGIILYKAEKYLPYLLPSLLQQDYKNLEVFLQDQSPNAECFQFIQEYFSQAFDAFHIQKAENIFHSGGHNKLIEQSTGDYYICGSNDMYYPTNFVSKLVKELEKKENKYYGSATVKIMKWDFDELSKNSENEELASSSTIDSCGLGITKYHRFYDRAQGQKDIGQYDMQEEVFGSSGALAIFRRSSLEKIAYSSKKKKEYFDELLHYKNDVDIAYRFQWAGEKCLYIPSVKVYHDRQVSSQGALFFRRNRSSWEKENSYFGQKVVLLKNFSAQFSFSLRFLSFFYSLCFDIYAFFFEPNLLKQKQKIRKHFLEIQEKKAFIKKKVSAKKIEQYMH